MSQHSKRIYKLKMQQLLKFKSDLNLYFNQEDNQDNSNNLNYLMLGVVIINHFTITIITK